MMDSGVVNTMFRAVVEEEDSNLRYSRPRPRPRTRFPSHVIIFLLLLVRHSMLLYVFTRLRIIGTVTFIPKAGHKKLFRCWKQSFGKLSSIGINAITNFIIVLTDSRVIDVAIGIVVNMRIVYHFMIIHTYNSTTYRMMCGYLKNLGFIHGVAVCVRLQLFHVEVKVFLCVLEVKTEIEEATTRLLVD